MLLAEGARHEGFGRALGSARAPRHINLGWAHLGRRHVETFAGVEAFSLAHNVGGSDAVGCAIWRQLTFLVAADRASRRNARDSTGGILGTFDRRLGGIAGSAAETFYLLARVIERRAHVRALLFKPTVNGCEKSLALRRLLRRGRLVLRNCHGRHQYKAGRE